MEPNTIAPRPTDADGRYSNYFKVGHNAFEFLLDFGQAYVDAGGDAVHTRIVTTPPYARALADLLLKSLRHYEANFGPIPRAQEDEALEESE